MGGSVSKNGRVKNLDLGLFSVSATVGSKSSFSSNILLTTSSIPDKHLDPICHFQNNHLKIFVLSVEMNVSFVLFALTPLFIEPSFAPSTK